MFVLTLPYPPSVNDYYGRANGHVYIKPAGRAFRRAVLNVVSRHDAAVFEDYRHDSPELAARVVLNPPERRQAQDADNGHKALLDALTKAKVWTDDRQVRLLLTEYGEPIAQGSVTIFVEKLSKVSVAFDLSR